MAQICPAPAPEEPLVRGLLNVVDCNVQGLVHSGYAALFQPDSPFVSVLNTLMILYVAVYGYNLLLGRAQLRVTDLTMTVVKLGVVLMLATRWSVYQQVVYDFLFEGPQQIARVLVTAVRPTSSGFNGDVFDGLQRALDQFALHAGAYAQGSSSLSSPLLGGPGFGAFALTMASTILLFSSLGVLLAAKIVLGLLLAVGPLFIALLLFESTRGVFEGWLRAALGFAFAPLATTVMLGVALTMLEPALAQLAAFRAAGNLSLAPVYAIFTLVLVFAAVAAGLVIAGGWIAGSFRLPRAVAPTVGAGHERIVESTDDIATQSRAARIASAVAAQERRETRYAPSASASGADRRASIKLVEDKLPVAEGGAASKGAELARRARPRDRRPGARSVK